MSLSSRNARAPLSLALGVTLCFATLAPPTSARADETHYQSIFMGDRTVGMGGAATGLAYDTAAMMYNPAGLAQLPSHSFAASLGVNAFERLRYQRGFSFDERTIDLNQTSRNSIPVFAGAILRFGKRDDNNRRRNTLGFMTARPATVNRTFFATAIDEMSGLSSRLEVERRFATTWYGLSYARFLSRKVQVGLTMIYAQQRLNYTERIELLTGGTATPGQPGFFTGTDVAEFDTRVRMRTHDLLARLAVLHRPSWRIRWGLMVQLPAIPMRDKASFDQRTTSVTFDEMDVTQRFTTERERGLGASIPIPWLVRAGLSSHLSSHFTMALDVQLTGRVSSGRSLRGLPTGVDIGVPRPAVLFPNDRERTFTVDASLGGELTLADGLTLRAGTFTNRSAAPAVPRETDAYAHPDIDFYGGTAGVGVHLAGYHLTFGLAGMRGRGDALSFRDNGGSGAPPGYVRTRADSRTIYFFITGATQSISRLAARTVSSMHDHRGDEHAPDGESESEPETETETDPDEPPPPSYDERDGPEDMHPEHWCL